MKKILLSGVLVIVASLPAFADQQTATLSIPGMNCTTCPITLKIALQKVAGVSSVDVSYADREAVVTFDDDHTSLEALTRATADIGYPSQPKYADTETH